MAKKVSRFVVCSVRLIMADFLTTEAQQTTIGIDLIIYSYYVLKVIVGLRNIFQAEHPVST